MTPGNEEGFKHWLEDIEAKSWKMSKSLIGKELKIGDSRQVKQQSQRQRSIKVPGWFWLQQEIWND